MPHPLAGSAIKPENLPEVLTFISLGSSDQRVKPHTWTMLSQILLRAVPRPKGNQNTE